MGESVRISTLMIERYHVGEVTEEERRLVESALAQDATLAASLAELDGLDAEFLQKHPPERMVAQLIREAQRQHGTERFPWLRKGLRSRAMAALLVFAIGGPLLFMFALRMYPANSREALTDRAKGGAESALSAGVELAVYLKASARDIQLDEQQVLHSGNTIQLAYQVIVEGATQGRTGNLDRYGVIFSIDGRSVVTLHYPYSPERSAVLVTGKQVPLEEAYTLDDAPNFEKFFFIVDAKPLDTRSILATAETMARNLETCEENLSALFEEYELVTLTLRKD